MYKFPKSLAAFAILAVSTASNNIGVANKLAASGTNKLFDLDIVGEADLLTTGRTLNLVVVLFLLVIKILILIVEVAVILKILLIVKGKKILLEISKVLMNFLDVCVKLRIFTFKYLF